MSTALPLREGQEMKPGALVTECPAVSKLKWLPKGFWPELDELRKQHRAAIRRRDRAREAAQEIGARFKAEDEAREKAYRTGLEVPKVTDPAERERLVNDARAKFTAAEDEFKATVDRVVRAIQDKEQEWTDDLIGRRREVEHQRAEAEKVLAESEQKAAELGVLRRWLARTAENRAWRQVPYEDLGVPGAPVAGQHASAFGGEDMSVHPPEDIPHKSGPPRYPVEEGEIL